MTEPRYKVVRIVSGGAYRQYPFGRLHLFDTTIPEPQNGGDRTQLVCRLFSSGGYDIEDVAELAEDAASFGTVQAQWPVHQRCIDIAWNEYLDGVVDGEHS